MRAGRKQYRYHADFRAKRDSAKYRRPARIRQGAAEAAAAGRAGPQAAARSSRDTVLAAVVRLLDTEHIRIGNEEYAKDNKSFGATTLRSRHLRRKGSKLKMRFAGKHGIVHEVTITDTNLKRIVQALPGAARARCCSNTSTATASRSRSPRATSTTISARRPAATSPPSISAPGARASSPSSSC